MSVLRSLKEQIDALDRGLERLAAHSYPETAVLRQVDLVGLHTALRFVLTVQEPLRIERSRDVAAYFGLVARRKQSGECDPELRITKGGYREMRRLQVQCAQQMLGPFGKDFDLRWWGRELAARGGKSAKKKAVVPVARKLSVLLHALWKTGEVYEPLRNELKNMGREESAAATPA